ncbi:MAG TPA: ABC transporter ATP-binding protein [Stellaceae bacterium]|nr:ABC transporter ATP-binding protein [Stellaceae bacterium]
MGAGGAILDLTLARPLAEPDGAPQAPYTLKLDPGELALIDAPDEAHSSWFADLCCGLVPLAEGKACFLGRDWAAMPHDFAAALRGRIGRVFAKGGWIGFLDVAANVLLPQLHHTRNDVGILRDRAASLARAFGLPGLPLERAADLSPADLVRAACVRAFLGDPLLVVLESPASGRLSDLEAPLLDAVAAARGRGAAVLWLSRNERVLRDRSFPASHRWRLDERGLAPAGRPP